MTKPSELSLMPEVFEGNGGDLIIRQEWPDAEGERYALVIIPMHRALELATAIIDCYRVTALRE